MTVSLAVDEASDAGPAEVFWTPEVAARLDAIAVPFVRRVTAARVAAAARARGVRLVDGAFFDRAASY